MKDKRKGYTKALWNRDVDFDWIPKVSDSDFKPDIDPVKIDDMFFRDYINTEDDAEEDSSANSKTGNVECRSQLA